MFMLTDFPQAQRAADLTGEVREGAFSEIAGEVSVGLPRDKAGSEAGTFIPAFLPIAEDQSGSYLMVDQRPGPQRGCVFIFDRDEADTSAVRWRSFADLCKKTYKAMQDDVVVEGTKYRPVGFGGRLTWEAG